MTRSELLSRLDTAWKYQSVIVRDALRLVVASHYPTVVEADETTVVQVCAQDGRVYPCETINIIAREFEKL